ncbi:MAG: Asp-tRNA(Asn)/Glu-tRNA(Gln) amidotransferase subunit GatC [Desulfobacteraceae bacterium]|nr:Asp-tRNA(Asn)/Glu-tRNA(Gln) amidotransferase subunit GatC [Desulfobacteraceae bacterium]MCF8094993.1 Asp-tRNA(Asn)/Glu-tRNA(Gln) amidotransferase subunit GatC [Desulfobacteraceae bacterium]
MKITKEQVRHVAELARLDIDEADLDGFARDLGDILEHAESLGRVDTTDVPPTSHAVEICNAFREDFITGHLENKDALENAPEAEEGSFVVPRIIE